MSELFLVRHAQASFGSENYDHLSELGFQQARWLGEWFQHRGIYPDRIVTGTLLRQKQTAECISENLPKPCPSEEDAGFDEFDFHALTALYCRLTDQTLPGPEAGPRPFFQLLRKAMLAWSRGELHATANSKFKPPLESWQEFNTRVAESMSRLQAAQKNQKIVVVSSGGAIAMALSQILQCSVETLVDLNLQAKNSGFSHLFFNQRTMLLNSFNNAPHIETAERHHALTYT